MFSHYGFVFSVTCRRIINIDFADAALWQVRSLSRFDKRLIKSQHGGEPQHSVMVSDQFEGLSIYRYLRPLDVLGRKFISTCGLKHPLMVQNTWSAWVLHWNNQEVSSHLRNVVSNLFSCFLVHGRVNLMNITSQVLKHNHCTRDKYIWALMQNCNISVSVMFHCSQPCNFQINIAYVLASTLCQRQD